MTDVTLLRKRVSVCVCVFWGF